MRQRCFGACAFRIDALHVVWIGIDLTIIGHREFLGAVLLVIHYKAELSACAAGFDLQRLFAGFGGEWNAHYCQPLLLFFNHADTIVAVLHHWCCFAGGQGNDGDAAGYAILCGQGVGGERQQQ